MPMLPVECWTKVAVIAALTSGKLGFKFYGLDDVPETVNVLRAILRAGGFDT